MKELWDNLPETTKAIMVERWKSAGRPGRHPATEIHFQATKDDPRRDPACPGCEAWGLCMFHGMTEEERSSFRNRRSEAAKARNASRKASETAGASNQANGSPVGVAPAVSADDEGWGDEPSPDDEGWT